MALRTRLSLAFIFVVLIPVVVGALLVAVVAPRVLHDQLGDRLKIARTTVADVLAAKCGDAAQTARVLGLEIAAIGPEAAVRRVLDESGADYAVVQDTTGKIVASAGGIAGASNASPDVFDSCATGKNAAVAISAKAGLAIAAMPTLNSAAVAWGIGPQTSSELSRQLDGNPAVTLVAEGRVVSTTLPAGAAAAQAKAAASSAPAVRDLGSRVLAISPATAAQPYAVVVSDSRPATTTLSWILIAVVAATIVAAFTIGRLLARLISRPVVELSEGAARVAAGGLDTTIAVRSRDEVGRLASAFNHMTAELRTYIGALERSRDELRQNLDRLGATLAHTHDLDGILAVVLDTAIASARASGGAILFLDADLALRVRLRRGLISIADGASVPLGTGISGTVAKTGEPVRGVVGDGPGLRPAPGEPADAMVIAVPLKQSGRIVGVLNLYNASNERQFSAHDLETIRAFASQASVAIDNVLLHQEAQRLSLTDPMTGLWNYRYLTIGLGHEIERATRFGRPLAVLMLDLDRFKQVNDRYGHQVGDAVLAELAERMHTQVREVDTLARYGGEEFVVVLPETDAAGASQTASRLGAVIKATPFCANTDHPLPVTASIGVAVFPEHGSTPSLLLRRADDALYAAKEAGRDCWRMASSDDSFDSEAALDGEAGVVLGGEAIETDEAALREAFDETSPRSTGGPPSGAPPPMNRPNLVVMPDVEELRASDP